MEEAKVTKSLKLLTDIVTILFSIGVLYGFLWVILS